MPVPASDTDCGLPGASSVMVTVAVRAPVAAGVKLMLIVQLAPTPTEPAPVGQVLPAAKAKSAACAPVMVMLVRFSGVPPLLVSVRFCAALVVPTLFFLMIRRPPRSTPFPCATLFRSSDTDCGLPGASSVMVTVAVRAPVAAGVNVTVKAQLADAATGPPARGHGATPEPATAKSPAFEPARAMLVTLRLAVPLLVRVTACAGLLLLRR